MTSPAAPVPQPKPTTPPPLVIVLILAPDGEHVLDVRVEHLDCVLALVPTASTALSVFSKEASHHVA